MKIQDLFDKVEKHSSNLDCYNFVIDSVFNFCVSGIYANCGSLFVFCVNAYFNEKLTRKLIAKSLLAVFSNENIKTRLGQKSSLVFNDIVNGNIDNIFKILQPDKTWTDESNLGVNANTGRMLIIRHITKDELIAIVKEEESKG